MSRMVRVAILSLSALAAGCAGPASLQTDIGHPANPGSSEGPVVRSVRLEPDEFDRAPGGVDVADPRVVRPSHHGTHTPSPGHVHPRPRRSASQPDSYVSPGWPSDSTKALFVCPMHPEVADARASECPKCGMMLVPRKEKR